MNWTRRDLGGLTLGAGTLAALPPALAAGLARSAETTIAHGVSAFGDLKYPADFSRFDYVDPDAPVGGTFSTGVAEISFDSLNGYILKGNPEALVTLLFDSLMTSAYDEADSMYGLVASSIEYPDDRLWAAFEIRPEAKFADGSQITAEDVVFSLEALLEKGHPRFQVMLAAVTGATSESPSRVRSDFHPDAARRDLPMAVAGLPVFSKAWYTQYDFSESSLVPPLGCSPYEVESFETGRTITYRRREDYWGWHLPVNKGRWNFERIRLEYFRDRTAEFEAFKGGAFTYKEEFWSKQWATGYDFPAVTRNDVVRETLPDNRPAGTQGYWFNTRREKFADPRVREAIGLAFDFEWSNSRLFFDLYWQLLELGYTEQQIADHAVLWGHRSQLPGEITLMQAVFDLAEHKQIVRAATFLPCVGRSVAPDMPDEPPMAMPPAKPKNSTEFRAAMLTEWREFRPEVSALIWAPAPMRATVSESR